MVFSALAGSGKDLVMKLGLDTQDFDAKAKGLIGSNTAIAAGAVAIATGYFKALNALGDFTQLAREQARAEKQLTLVIKNTNAQVSVQRLRAFASARQAVTNFGDEVTLQSARLLAPLGLSQEAFEQTLIAAQNLAESGGVSLRNATQSILRATQGSTRSLAKYGVVIDQTTEAALKGADAQTKLNAIVGEVNSTLGGLAEEGVDPVEQFNNALGDLQEVVGELIRNDVGGAFDDLTESINLLQTALGNFGSDGFSPVRDSLSKVVNSSILNDFANLSDDLLQIARLIEALSAADLERIGDELGRTLTRGVLEAVTLGVIDEETKAGIIDAIDRLGVPQVQVEQLADTPTTLDRPAPFRTDRGGLSPEPEEPDPPTTRRPRGLTPEQQSNLEAERAAQEQLAEERRRALAERVDEERRFIEFQDESREDSRRSLRAELDEETARRLALFDLRMANEARIREAQRESARELAANINGIAVPALASLGTFLGELATQQEGAAERLGKALLAQAGNELVGLGTNMLFKGLSYGIESLGTDPRAYLFGIGGAAAITAGAALGATASAITPPGAGGGASARAPSPGGARSAAGGGQTTVVINNNYGAIGPRPEDQARELARVIGAGRRAGVAI